MALPLNKTKIICTIGPASESPAILLNMLDAGMNIARLNFSHGDFSWHKTVIDNIQSAARMSGKPVTIMADLPGPKIRIGQLTEEPIQLMQNDMFTLTTQEIIGDCRRASVNFPRLPVIVKPGDIMSLNDGIIHLEVVKVEEQEVRCQVLIGGELRSHKGLNLPGINLGITAFTEHDHDCLKFALTHGVDVISQSFVETAADIDAVRNAATELGFNVFIIAKIERAGALTYIDEILKAADGIMVARGDLGVETPMERIAVVQKQLISRANLFGKPVITATQMLESMVDHYRPTRAESTDVANAVLDGTDCVMLSEESAMGQFPVEAVKMLAKIAGATEPHRTDVSTREVFADYNRDTDVHLVDIISRNVQRTVARLAPIAVIAPTATGNIARMISRFKLPTWIVVASPNGAICRGLQFSYGVVPIQTEYPLNWKEFARSWVQSEKLPEELIVMAECPCQRTPHVSPHLDIIDLRTTMHTETQ